MEKACLKIIFLLFQSDDSDIWDDTALIKAYDKAVASFKVKQVLSSVCACKSMCMFAFAT